MKAWKLFRLKANGQVTPLFANFKEELPIGVWMDAVLHTTKDLMPRKGWHCVLKPSAPHLSEKGRIWLVVEIEDYERHVRNKHQGEAWYVAQRMKIVTSRNNSKIRKTWK